MGDKCLVMVFKNLEKVWIICSESASRSPSDVTHFPINLSVSLYTITGLCHTGLGAACNVICLLSPPMSCLFGGKANHVLPLSMSLSPWENLETLIPSQGTLNNANSSLLMSSYPLYINLYCVSSMYPCWQNKPLWWEWNEAECIPGCEWLCLVALYAASLMENYGDGLAELTAIWIYIPHKFPWDPGKKI